MVIDVDPSITVVKTATPGSMPEPGGEVSFHVEVTNNSNETVWLTSLIDTEFGDLDGQGNCVADGSVAIAVGATFSCTFNGFVTGDAGFVHENTVVAIVIDDEKTEASNFDNATVTLTDVPPQVTVVKTANPTEIFSGEVVQFSIVVHNASAEAVTLTSLTDSIYGNLNGVGTCATGGVIPAGGDYECAFSAVVNATETDVVTASVVDNDGSTDSDNDDATVTVKDDPTLAIEKLNDAPLVLDLPTAEEGTTVTFTLLYTISSPDGITNAVITDVLPVGLDYVDGSATNSADFTFVGYDAATRTLTWTAASIAADGQVSYQAVVAIGAAEFAQPLENVATIQSDRTQPDSDVSDVFVPAPPAAATGTPPATLPPTDALGSTTGSSSGLGLMLALAVLGAVLLVVAFVTPTPAVMRRRR